MIVVEVPPDLICTQSNIQTPNEEASQVASDENKSFTSSKWSKIRNDTNDRLESVRLDISFKSPTHTGLQTTGLVIAFTRVIDVSVRNQLYMLLFHLHASSFLELDLFNLNWS